MTTLLVDLGGTRLKAAVRPDDVVAVEHCGGWADAVRSAAARFGADEVALAVPGIVDGGRVISLPGKLAGIENADLAATLGLRVVVLVNDAIAYGIGEATAGAGAGEDRVVVVTLGTGVGVAVLEDGHPLGGGPLGGGLLGGQIRIGGDDGADTSGRSGTFEAACRADSLVAAVPGASDVSRAYALLDAEDPDAVRGFASYRRQLVRGLTALCLAHAPSCVVVGGGAARADLLEGVQEAVAEGLWPGQSVRVRLGQLGDGAALVGLQALLRARVTA